MMDDKTIKAVIIGIETFALALMAGSLWIAIHFIRKYW